jgi:predicted PurR-regulated permease PerM
VINLNLTTATRIGLNGLALLGAAVALWLGESIFVPLTIAVLLAAILWPVVQWLNERLRIPWAVASATAVGLLIIFFGVVTLGFVLGGSKILLDLPKPDNPEEQQKFYTSLRHQVLKVSPVSVESVLPDQAEDSELFKYLRDMLRRENINKVLVPLLKYLNNWLLQLVLIMFILLFLLMEGKMLTQRVVEIFGPSPEAQAKAVDALAQMAKSVRGYLVWRTIVNFGLGLILGLVYSGAGLKQAWTWAMLAAVLCYVPYIGTIIAGVPPVLDAFVSVSPLAALGILLFYIVVVTVEGYLIVPLVMGRSMELNATTVLLACLFWDLVWGTPGLFLAMPLMAALKAICMHVPGWRPWANLMGTYAGPAEQEPEAKVDVEPSPQAAVVVSEADPDKTLLMGPPPIKTASAKHAE